MSYDLKIYKYKKTVKKICVTRTDHIAQNLIDKFNFDKIFLQ